MNNSIVSRVTDFFNNSKKAEGPRGVSNRISIILKHFSYFFIIIIFSTFAQYLTNGIAHANDGGLFILYSASIVYIVGSIATVFYANLRKEIVERTKHYAFGIILFPGTLIALLMKTSTAWLGSDTFGNTLGQALPVVFLATVIIPALVFVKEMAGIRTLYRTKLDDQEQVTLWTRNDGLQR